MLPTIYSLMYLDSLTIYELLISLSLLHLNNA